MHAISEAEFAELVDTLGDDPRRRGELVGLLHESHPAYDERGTTATVRMRGWILTTLARGGLPDAGLVYALEELESGRDAYLVAAAARALRSRPGPDPAFARYLAQAITNVRYHDDFVSFASYGAYVDDDESGVTALSEIFATLRWLGRAGSRALPQLDALVEDGRRGVLPATILKEVRQTIAAIQHEDVRGESEDTCCSLPWANEHRFKDRDSRARSSAIDSTVFEDHDGRQITFAEFFRGKPSVVVFFYTRCDNPRKCSLSIMKLARVQALISERGLKGQVRTAAITYDPGWDHTDRLRDYAQSRSVPLDMDNRMLRSTADGLASIREHFGLGVNYIESLVNRHRVEAFVVDADGRVAAAFERLEWDETEVVGTLESVLRESRSHVPNELASGRPSVTASARLLSSVAPIVSLTAAFFPKCPVCWATYLSMVGVAGLERLPYLPWLLTLSLCLMAINLWFLWWRGRSTGRMAAFGLGIAGAFAIAVPGMLLHVSQARSAGVWLTLGASILSAMASKDRAGRPAPAERAAGSRTRRMGR